jgi:hypothetical protein
LLIQKEQRIRVRVANGELVVSEGNCLNVQIQLSGFFFLIDTYVISLAGCDMVLGIQWLVTLGSITWNFKVLTMEFTIDEKTILLQGLVAPNPWEEIELFEIKDEYTKGLLLQLLEDVVDTGLVEARSDLATLLNEFGDLFEEPKGLLSSRSHDHAIILKIGSRVFL